ncbi:MULTISPECIES: hypothetical protein [unclassified Paraburkholderia]|uniref:hypothetical protein n=1 Tax=unclassified Paraburkholderia TaxID=2615204 RepID=UPI002AB1ED99|nr:MULTISPECIES: hypothetical protein [unclassified Paraburkholderia]
MKSIRYWHRNIQPLVNQHYRLHSDTTDTSRRVRADVGWNWWHYASYALGHNLAVRSHSAPPSLVCGWAMMLALQGQKPARVPVGLLTAVPDFVCHVGGTTGGRGFVWYLSNAPAEFFRDKIKAPALEGIAEALLDTTIQTRLDFCGDATTLLHAEPEGGSRLQSFYRGLGMKEVTMSERVSLFRGAKPGEYFGFEDKEARTFADRFASRRGQ